MTVGRALLLALIAAASPAAARQPQAAQQELMVADFNSGEKPNNLGGDFGAWIRDPNDPMQGALESFDRANRSGKSGYALRLIYSVDSAKPAFGGLWMRLQKLDASRFASLKFRVRGDSAMGFTQVLKVELKDSLGQASHFYVRGVTDQWQDVSIPLAAFEGMANLHSLNEFTITIEDTTATAKKGVLYFDDIRFSKAQS